VQKPTLVISHKTKDTAAPLTMEFKENSSRTTPTGYFVSYYDYYSPKHTYRRRPRHHSREGRQQKTIDLDRLRLSATSNLE